MKQSDFWSLCGVVSMAPHMGIWGATAFTLYCLFRVVIALRKEGD